MTTAAFVPLRPSIKTYTVTNLVIIFDVCSKDHNSILLFGGPYQNSCSEFVPRF